MHYSFIRWRKFFTRVPCIKQLRKNNFNFNFIVIVKVALTGIVQAAPQVSLSCSCMSLRSLHRFNQLPGPHSAPYVPQPPPIWQSPLTLLHTLRAHYDVMCSIIFIFYSYLHFTTQLHPGANPTASCLFF